GSDEVAVAAKSLAQYYAGQPLKQLSQALPQIKGFKGNSVIVRGVTFYLRSSSQFHLKWAFKKKYVKKVAKKFNLKLTEDMKLVADDEVAVTQHGLPEVFYVRWERCRLIQVSLGRPIPARRDVKRGGAVFSIRYTTTNIPLWTFKRKDIELVAKYFNLKVKPAGKILGLAEGEIPMTATGLPELFIGMGTDLKKKVDAILPNPRQYQRNEFVIDGVTFKRRIRHAGAIIWAFDEEDKHNVAKLFGFILRRKLIRPGKYEVAVTVEGLYEVYIGNPMTFQRKVIKLLGKPKLAKVDVKEVGGIVFRRRQKGAKIIWVFHRNDIEKVSKYFDFPIRQIEIKDIPKDEVAVSSYIRFIELFHNGHRAWKVIRDKLPDPEEAKDIQYVYEDKITFTKRITKGHRNIVWAFKVRDAQEVADCFGLVLRRNLKPVGNEDVRISGPDLDQIYVNGGKEVMKMLSELDEVPIRRARKRLGGVSYTLKTSPTGKVPTVYWTFNRKSINKVAEHFGLTIRAKLPVLKPDEVGIIGLQLGKLFFGSGNKSRDLMLFELPDADTYDKPSFRLGKVTYFRRLTFHSQVVWVFKEKEAKLVAEHFGFALRSEGKPLRKNLTDYEKAIDIFKKYDVLDLAVNLSSNPGVMQQALTMLLTAQEVDMKEEELSRLSRAFILNLREGYGLPKEATLEPGNPFDYLRGLMSFQDKIEQMQEYEQLVLVRVFIRIALFEFARDFRKALEKVYEVLEPIRGTNFFRKLIFHIQTELGEGLNFQPEHIRTAMLAHQRIGAWYMRQSEKLQKKGIFGFLLEDDTRIGKTIQTYAAMDTSWKVLITVPAGMMDTWEEQFSQHTTGKMRFIPVTGTPEKKLKIITENRKRKGTILLCSIEDFRQRSDEEIAILSEGLDLMVVDEAQKIENFAGLESRTGSLQAQAVHKVKTKRKWILTASPYTSHPRQLFSIFNLLYTDPDTGEVSDPLFADPRTFKRVLTGNINQMKWLYALKTKIGLRRIKSEMGMLYSRKKDIPPSKEGYYTITLQQSDLVLQIIKNLGEYIDIYNSIVPEEERIEKSSIGVLLKLQFLSWALTCPSVLVADIPTTFWDSMDKIVLKRLEKRKRGIICAQNVKIVDKTIERYQKLGYKVARLDGMVDGYAADRKGRVIRGYYKKGRLIIDSRGKPISAKAYQRYLFQHDPQTLLIVINMRAGLGIDLSAAQWVLNVQMPNNYVEYYQASDRAIGLNPFIEEGRQKAVEVLTMVARYPESFLKAKLKTKDRLHIEHGTPSEILYKAIMGPDKETFELVMEGIPPGKPVSEERALTRLVRGIHGFLEDPSMKAPKKERKKIETVSAMYPVYQKVKGDRLAEERVLSLVDLYERTEVNPGAFSRLAAKSKSFDSGDLIWAIALSRTPNKLHRDIILNYLPQIMEKVWKRQLNMNDIIERGPPAIKRLAELAPELILPLMAAGKLWEIEEGKADALSPTHPGTITLIQILEQIQEAGFSSYEQKQWMQRFIYGLVNIIDFESNDFLESISRIGFELTNGSLRLEEKICFFEELGVLCAAGDREYREVIAMRGSFRKIRQAMRRKMGSTFLKLFALPDTREVRNQVLDLVRSWGSLKAPIQLMAKLKEGEPKELAGHIEVLKKVMEHILDGTYRRWRNSQDIDLTGREITYRAKDEKFWEAFTREENVRLGRVTATQKDFRKARARIIERIIELLQNKEALRKAFGRLGDIINRDLKEDGIEARLQKDIKQKGRQRNILKSKAESKDIQAAIGAIDTQIKTLRARLNVIGLYRALEGELDAEKLLRLLHSVRTTILAYSKTEKEELLIDNLIKNLEDNLKQLGRPRRFEDVEVEITCDPELIMRRGMLNEDMMNCFNLSYRPDHVAALVDDLASRNKMLAVVRAGGRVASVAMLKVRQTAQAEPVIMIERPIYRWGYSFEREIAKAIAITKLADMHGVAVACDTYKSEAKKSVVVLYPTGARGPTEYHESLFGLRRREYKVWHSAAIIYEASHRTCLTDAVRGLGPVYEEYADMIEELPTRTFKGFRPAHNLGQVVALMDEEVWRRIAAKIWVKRQEYSDKEGNVIYHVCKQGEGIRLADIPEKDLSKVWVGAKDNESMMHLGKLQDKKLFPWQEDYRLSGIVKGNDETVEDILSSQEVKAHTKSGRKADSSLEGDSTYFNRQGMGKNRYETTVTNCSETLFTFLIIDTNKFSVLDTEDRVESSSIDIGVDFEPFGRAHKFERNDWAGNVFITFVGESYGMIRAHRKSCGWGTRIPISTALGFSAFARSRNWLGLPHRYILPLAMTIYSPAYLSTSSSKWFLSHLSALKRFATLFLVIPYSSIICTLNIPFLNGNVKLEGDRSERHQPRVPRSQNCFISALNSYRDRLGITDEQIGRFRN
ncbi:MAG: hypothetical protein JRI96_13860, partial [Deltaproteobacteria bacterium]|nr:hypothetical protein [Deltaproteobacteria bacterium]